MITKKLKLLLFILILLVLCNVVMASVFLAKNYKVTVTERHFVERTLVEPVTEKKFIRPSFQKQIVYERNVVEEVWDRQEALDRANLLLLRGEADE